eukprot:CAMPEP_0181297268 /NCGR_PEP_ID=MMETSP1101-20121128/5148_1 /TAXON_ID=46948 /ORGANISM="Rhodomonas abbreviata, Strain Caron Lab Isolate" /LENGTH=326 /DNA_ID=CAMNT_0023402191 /DNA_START=63 /DNA_END=1042 /DNA_ORIENTATION=-
MRRSVIALSAGCAGVVGVTLYRRYARGRMISVADFVLNAAARARMRAVVHRMLPLWECRYAHGGPAEIRFTESDVVVFTPPKSGTTWVTHMCHQIRMHGREISFEDQDDVVPWMNRLGTPYLRGTRFNDEPDAPHEASSARVQVASRVEGQARRHVQALWAIDRPLTEAEMCSFLLEAGDVEAALESLAASWACRGERVLILFYENILLDHAATVARLARFMEVELTQSELQAVVTQTTHAGMLAHHQAFACVKQATNAYAVRGLALDPARLTGKVRRPTGEKAALDEGVHMAVGRAWHYLGLPAKTGHADYTSLRTAARAELMGI